jgi:chaperonin cofactor prefoldin
MSREDKYIFPPHADGKNAERSLRLSESIQRVKEALESISGDITHLEEKIGYLLAEDEHVGVNDRREEYARELQLRVESLKGTREQIRNILEALKSDFFQGDASKLH